MQTYTEQINSDILKLESLDTLVSKVKQAGYDPVIDYNCGAVSITRADDKYINITPDEDHEGKYAVALLKIGPDGDEVIVAKQNVAEDDVVSTVAEVKHTTECKEPRFIESVMSRCEDSGDFVWAKDIQPGHEYIALEPINYGNVADCPFSENVVQFLKDSNYMNDNGDIVFPLYTHVKFIGTVDSANEFEINGQRFDMHFDDSFQFREA